MPRRRNKARCCNLKEKGEGSIPGRGWIGLRSTRLGKKKRGRGGSRSEKPIVVEKRRRLARRQQEEKERSLPLAARRRGKASHAPSLSGKKELAVQREGGDCERVGKKRLHLLGKGTQTYNRQRQGAKHITAPSFFGGTCKRKEEKNLRKPERKKKGCYSDKWSERKDVLFSPPEKTRSTERKALFGEGNRASG